MVFSFGFVRLLIRARCVVIGCGGGWHWRGRLVDDLALVVAGGVAFRLR